MQEVNHEAILQDIVSCKALRIEQLKIKKGAKKTVPFITAECVKRARGKGDKNHEVFRQCDLVMDQIQKELQSPDPKTFDILIRKLQMCSNVKSY